MKRIDTDINVKSREPRCIAAVGAELSKLKKAEKGPIQQKVYDFTRKFSRLSVLQAEKLIKELEDLEIPRMTKEHIISIVDILPRNDAELKIILAASKTMLKPEDIEKILGVVKKYIK